MHKIGLPSPWGPGVRGYVTNSASLNELGGSHMLSRRLIFPFVILGLAASLTLRTLADDQGDDWANKKSAWLTLTPAERGQVSDFAGDYETYLDIARTAEGSTREMIRRAKAAGFSDFTDAAQVKPGARLIIPDRDRALILAVIGSESIMEGTHVVGTHHDSPHIDLKGRPIYPAGGFALFKTVYYGGIKKYQWANIPLALVGRIDTTDGRTVDVSVGLNLGDPVFVIPDNAPHSDSELRSRTYTNVLQGEELDPVAGSVPGEKDSVEVEVVKLLTSTYKIKEEDLVSAELALVPASHPADVGFDHGLVGAYGQDDRVSSFCAVRALEDLKGTPSPLHGDGVSDKLRGSRFRE
jgi:aspartyl aminopeptidase